jgi:hypothetical protein
LLGVAALGGSVGGCDQGKPHDQITLGPLVSVSGANIGTDRTLPSDAPIQLQFDRMLLPSTVNRQAIALLDANNGQLLPSVTYDPVARIVTLAPQANDAWLLPDQPYKVVLHVARTDDDPYGLRAIDRAGLSPDDPHLEIGFLTSGPSGAGTTPPKSDYCRDVAPVFQQRCASPSCHGARTTGADPSRFGDGASSPAAGLILETSEGIRHAIGRVANGANTGARAAGSAPARVFGIDMPIVDPGFPANSWLMYKLLLAVPSDPKTVPTVPFAKCDGGAPAQPLGGLLPLPFATPPDDIERSILSGFVLGREMPYPNIGPSGPTNGNPALTFDELERVRLWIAEGAAVTSECVCAL